MAKIRQVTDILDEVDEGDDENYDGNDDLPVNPTAAQRIDVRQSPYLDTFHNHHAVRVVIDSNMIRHDTALRLGSKIKHSSQSAHQADGSSPLTIVGETTISLARKNNTFQFCGLVVQHLHVEMLAGTSFMEIIDITIRPAKRIITLADGTTYTYGTTRRALNRHAVRRVHVLRAPPTNITVWPGDFVEVNLPSDLYIEDATFALEPRHDTTGNKCVSENDVWPQPSLITSVEGVLRISNLTNTTRVLKRNEHFCQIREMFEPDNAAAVTYSQCTSEAMNIRNRSSKATPVKHSTSVTIDPDYALSSDERAAFRSILEEYDEVFDPNYTGYNGHVGPSKAVVNMGPVQPPQRK